MPNRPPFTTVQCFRVWSCHLLGSARSTPLDPVPRSGKCALVPTWKEEQPLERDTLCTVLRDVKPSDDSSSRSCASI
ncbi:hypothetical protein LX36DRAFT_652200 [Colletotrichum falcatum]|nr:hypothetical protein LX36DRAFT_652200 [Colletotrichum falcatum]